MTDKDLFLIELAVDSINKSSEEVFSKIIKSIALDIHVFKETCTRPVKGYLSNQVCSLVERLKSYVHNYNLDCLTEVIKMADVADSKFVSMVNEALDEEKLTIDLGEFRPV